MRRLPLIMPLIMAIQFIYRQSRKIRNLYVIQTIWDSPNS
jgi:hypothetical protein